MKKVVAITWLAMISLGVALLFWRYEWIYSLPTPIPANYKAVACGTPIRVRQTTSVVNDKPLFLHFFNPDCPCSRFNIPHFKSLVKQYGNEVNFEIVLMTKKKFTVQYIQKKFGLDIPVSFDTSLAATCGVYSTPQAVIINTDHQLYYRGNYNKSRYCTDKKTNYAQIALDALLNKNPTKVFAPLAVKAYGCQLPQCTK